jgi:hypothetical protein
VRFGYDSRDTLPVAEANLARLGMTWEGRPGATQPGPRRIVRHTRSLRHRTAAILYRLADWLAPGASTARPSAAM